MRLFLDGRVDAALAVLDESKLEAQYRQAHQTLATVVEAYLLRAAILSSQFDFARAERAYQAALTADPNSFAAAIAFAEFNTSLHRYEAARTTYETCRRLARNPADTARVLNGLGAIDQIENRSQDARRNFEAALATRRELAAQNPERSAADEAKTLNNLGLLEDSVGPINDALHIFQQLATNDSDAYLEYVATTLNNLAKVEQDTGLPASAAAHGEEALKICRQLVGRNPDRYSPDLAKTLHNLGTLHLRQKDLGPTTRVGRKGSRGLFARFGSNSE
jgi:tetratricopeptide (TPR) repeat protein